jgi:hypothetical protein
MAVKWTPNQASHGFLARAKYLRGRQGLPRWNKCEKVGEPGTRGYILWWPGKQNWKFRLKFDSIQLLQSLTDLHRANLTRHRARHGY